MTNYFVMKIFEFVLNLNYITYWSTLIGSQPTIVSTYIFTYFYKLKDAFGDWRKKSLIKIYVS